MTLNINSDQYAIVQSYADTGNYIEGWKYLSGIGDKYADNAYAVTSGTATGVDKGFEVLVKTHWENTAGTGVYEQKFDAVARQHFKQYVEAIHNNPNYQLPDSKQIEQSYRDAVVQNNLPPPVGGCRKSHNSQ